MSASRGSADRLQPSGEGMTIIALAEALARGLARAHQADEDANRIENEKAWPLGGSRQGNRQPAAS